MGFIRAMRVKVQARNLKLRLDSLILLFQEMEECSRMLNQPPEELHGLALRLEEGAILVDMCSKVTSWSLCKNYKYANKLSQLDQLLDALDPVLEVRRMRLVGSVVRESLVLQKQTKSTTRENIALCHAIMRVHDQPAKNMAGSEVVLCTCAKPLGGVSQIGDVTKGANKQPSSKLS